MTRKHDAVKPRVIAARVAKATGEPAINPRTYEGDPNVRWVYHFDDPAGGRVAVGAHDTRSGGTKHSAEVGWYDPATDRWLFYREYVRRGEEANIRSIVAGTALEEHRRRMPAAIASGRTVVDVHHPYTKEVRATMARTLRAADALSWVLRDGAALLGGEYQPARIEPPDEGTDVVATLGSSVNPIVHREQVNPYEAVERPTNVMQVASPGAFLVMAYAGVRAARDETEHTTRQEYALIVAKRSQDDPGIWVPELDVISPAEWEAIRELPEQLVAAQALHSRFSPVFCAVTHNSMLG